MPPEHSLLSLLRIYRQIVFWVSRYNSAMSSWEQVQQGEIPCWEARPSATPVSSQDACRDRGSCWVIFSLSTLIQKVPALSPSQRGRPRSFLKQGKPQIQLPAITELEGSRTSSLQICPKLPSYCQTSQCPFSIYTKYRHDDVQYLLSLWGCALKGKSTALERGCKNIFLNVFPTSVPAQADPGLSPTIHDSKNGPWLLSQSPHYFTFFFLFKSPVLKPGLYLLQKACFFFGVCS